MPAEPRIPAAALQLLLDQGFDSTSVDELAAAAGMSRSTFFRRYRSKEDMVFADQEARVESAAAALLRHDGDGPAALIPAALAVFDAHTGDAELAHLRWALLHAVPALRDRELVSTHRFERLFRDHLLADVERAEPGAVPRPDRRRVAALGLASAVVAVHNDFLRSWLRSPGHEVRASLERALRGLVQRHGHEAAGTGPSAGEGTTVVVVSAAGSGPQEIADQVERALRERG